MKTTAIPLNECIAIQKPVETQAASGGLQTTWTYLSKQVYAQVEFPGTGTDEKFLGDQQVAVTRVLFTIRYRTDFDEKYRIEFRSKLYDILNILETGPRRSYLKILAESRT